MTLKKWLCSSLPAAVSVAPIFVSAGTNDAADAKNTPSANADAAASPNPTPSPALALGDANVTALLGVLVMKGVLSVGTLDNVTAATGGMDVGCTVPVPTARTCSAAGGKWKIAPEHPIGAFGGFVNLGLPLSRWFNADPKGRNSAWNLYLHMGKDQVVHHDLARANGFGCTSADELTACNGGLPLLQSRMLAATLYYKLNAWTTFAFEQSQYQTTLLPDLTNYRRDLGDCGKGSEQNGKISGRSSARSSPFNRAARL
jgi:hypothetical protein